MVVMIDYFTKWSEAIPFRSQGAVTNVFVLKQISRHGAPLGPYSDQGAVIDSQLVREVTSILGVRKTNDAASSTRKRASWAHQ